MKLYIKYMVSNRCKEVVKTELRKLGLHFVVVDLGEVEIMEDITLEQHDQLKKELLAVGLELMDDRRGILVERIKNTIIELVHHSDEGIRTNFSVYLSKKLNQDYTYLANLFSEMQGTTIEQFMIRHKVERIKELILYGELNITEISLKMDYSSVAHLSNQFKKVTGLSPSHFKNLKDKKRNPIEDIGNLKEMVQEVLTSPIESQQSDSSEHASSLAEVIDVQDMFMQVPVAICILIGPKYRIEFANNMYLKIARRGSNIVGKTIATIFPELESQGIIGLLDDVMETGIAFHAHEMEIELVENGKKKRGFFSFVYQPLLGENGKIGGIIILANEVTDQVLLRSATFGQTSFIKDLVAPPTAFVCTLVGPDHIYSLVNEQYQQLIGNRELQGKSLLVALPELKGQGIDIVLDKVYNTGELYLGNEVPILISHDVGLAPELRYFNFSYQPMYDDSNVITGILVFGYEVTAEVVLKNRKQADQQKLAIELAQKVELRTRELQEVTRLLVEKNHEIELSKAKLLSEYSRRLIEASHDPLIVLNNDGQITDVNQAMIDVTDVPRDQLIGTDFSIYFTNPSEAKRICKDIFVHESVSNYPLTIIDHKLTDVLFNGSIYKDESGNVLGAVVVARDFTEQKKISNELNEARIAAELARGIAEEAKIRAEATTLIANEAVKSKQQFLSNMSHEIRTPMNAIIGFTKVMMKTELAAKQKEYLTAIQLSGDALIVLINDILDLAKVDAGKMSFEKKPFRLAFSITAMLNIFAVKIQEKNLLLVKNYDSRIPDVLLGDPVRLHQVIINLLSNALKFTAAGQITLNVIMLDETDETVKVEISIADTGIGILKSDLINIFDNFQQTSSETARLYGGTGLGLAIVKQLVEAQGGKVLAESEKGAGSKFSFTLDFLKTTDTATNEVMQGEPEMELNHIHVLVVEDMPLNQLLVKTLLDEFGFECDIAENGKIALEMIQAKIYDIILMDLQMPIMNGFETTDYIRNVLGSDVPIIALTADVTTVDREKCTKVGMNDYISKPVDERLLYSKIMTLVKHTALVIPTINIKKAKAKKVQFTNLEYLHKRTKSNPALMIEILNAYLKQAPPLIIAMKTSYSDQDWSVLYSAVHKMIPSFSIMGINDAYEQMAKKVQAFASTQEQPEGIQEMILELETVLNQSCDEILEELNKIENLNV
jgi:PAS domain S-box-containing protein